MSDPDINLFDPDMYSTGGGALASFSSCPSSHANIRFRIDYLSIFLRNGLTADITLQHFHSALKQKEGSACQPTAIRIKTGLSRRWKP